MNVNDVLIGIDASDRIVQGMFFRLSWAPSFFILSSTFNANIQGAFDELDAGGLGEPVSDLAVTSGQYAAVFDILVRPAAIGITAADLANALNGMRFGLSLTSMTRIDAAAVQGGASERDALQTELDIATRQKDPLQVFGSYAKYLEWILILLIIIALLYYGQKAFKVVKAVV